MKSFKTISSEILALIKSHNTIIIHRHINPDGDALGSQWGLKTIIEDNFSNKKVLTPGDMNDYMSGLFPTPTLVKREDYENALVIVCDTANQERISGEFWNQGQVIVKFDHHPIVEQYGHINLVETTASAACQVIGKWAEICKLKLSPQAARNLFLGLVTDSGRFLYRSVNSETFQVASFLVKQNFNLLELYDCLYTQNLKIARIKGYILQNFNITKNGVGYFVFKKEIVDQIQTDINKQNKLLKITENVEIRKEDLTSQVNAMAGIKGIKIWLVVAEDKFDNIIKASVRSAKWIINETVARYGGGGHQTAAGVKLKNYEAIDALINDLDQIALKPPELTSN